MTRPVTKQAPGLAKSKVGSPNYRQYTWSQIMWL